MIFSKFPNFIHLLFKAIQNAIAPDRGLQQAIEESSPTWQNWSKNIAYAHPNDENYYFRPTNATELASVLERAREQNNNNVKTVVRVSGQRHSQPPLVIHDNRNNINPEQVYLVDMSCYRDVGEDNKGMELIEGDKILVNTGVREDELEDFLIQNNLMMQTVTAGGFFSLGGITAVDVHGATIAAPIFAETVSSFTIMNANSELITIENPDDLKFARVSLGGLGIVTTIILDAISPRKVEGSTDSLSADDVSNQDAFIDKFHQLSLDYERIEVFFNPYAAGEERRFLLLLWNPTQSSSGNDSNVRGVASACDLSHSNDFGAGDIPLGNVEGIRAQKEKEKAGRLVKLAIVQAEIWAMQANNQGLELWLEKGIGMFMSYSIELGDIYQDPTRLGIAWDALQVVANLLEPEGQDFYIAGPMEFRFVKGGTSAMSGILTDNPDTYFVNLDLLGFVEPTRGDEYPLALQKFFADVEREWFENFNGVPHHGKMYGFYDPDNNEPSGPFNQNFITKLRDRRGQPWRDFKAFCKGFDETGLFYNDYLRSLLGE